MQFQVPQFIEMEDKIFGPLTFKQFIYLAGGAGLSYIVSRVLPLYLAAPIIVGAIGLTIALAFVQWNGRPFIVALEHAFYYLTRGKLYLWDNTRRQKQAPSRGPAVPTSSAAAYVPKLSESKLHELAWSLDIKERIAAGVESGEDRETMPASSIVAPIRTARGALVR